VRTWLAVTLPLLICKLFASGHERCTRGLLLFFVLTQRKDNKRKVKANPIPPGVLPALPAWLAFSAKRCREKN
jgi:hypothetical protein